MTEGRLVLVFDDGYAEDYEDIRPILESRGVPAVLAIVPKLLDGEGHLTTDQLHELVDLGWEVAVHGHRHRHLQAHHLARDADPGDERLFLDGDHVFPDEETAVYVGDSLEVADSEDPDVPGEAGANHRETVEVKAKGAKDHAEYVDIAEPLRSGFDAEETIVRPTESLLREEIVGGRETLRSLGFDPDTFVFPYGAASVRAWTLVREEYEVVANAAIRSLPNPPGTPLGNLRRWYLETTHLTPPEISDYLDAVSEEGGIGILAGHSSWDTVPPERVENVIEMADERDIAIPTFRDL